MKKSIEKLKEKLIFSKTNKQEDQAAGNKVKELEDYTNCDDKGKLERLAKSSDFVFKQEDIDNGVKTKENEHQRFINLRDKNVLEVGIKKQSVVMANQVGELEKRKIKSKANKTENSKTSSTGNKLSTVDAYRYRPDNSTLRRSYGIGIDLIITNNAVFNDMVEQAVIVEEDTDYIEGDIKKKISLAIKKLDWKDNMLLQEILLAVRRHALAQKNWEDDDSLCEDISNIGEKVGQEEIEEICRAKFEEINSEVRKALIEQSLKQQFEVRKD